MTKSHIAALRELADDLESIIAVVSTRDGDATARQHARAEAVRAAVAVCERAAMESSYGDSLKTNPIDICQTRCQHSDLESILRRALTDAVLNEAWLSAVAQSTFAEDSTSSCAAQRDVLITAILTAARETGQ